MRDDVIVIGGGLAGMTAALAATSEGAAGRLLSHKESTLRAASGLIDVLGYRPDGSGPLDDPFAAFEALPDHHPYRIVGEAAVRDALALFDDVTGASYHGGHTDANALLPTFGGTLKPTARYPASTASGLASRPMDTLLVGFDALVDFDAPTAAAHLRAAGVPFDVRGVTVDFPADFRADAKLTRYATALDKNESFGGGRCRAALAQLVARNLDGEGRIGFPAVLGDERADAVRGELAERLGVPVFEIPMGPPSLPGLRLQDRFDAALHDHGVAVETGNPVVGFETDERGRVTAVRVDRNGAELAYRADQFVLATGGLVSGGIETTRETVREPIFGCRIDVPSDRTEWSAPDAFGDHAFARFGVHPDDDLRPLDETLEPEYENLRAAGAVIGGFDFAAEKSGSGVSLATGYAAGTAAARDL